MLLVSPERLNNPGFRDEVLPRLAATCGLLVVDEAHCISDWGHDFRPDYRRIRTLLDDLPAGIPVLATTATANARVTADVAEQLGSQPTTRAGAARVAGPRVAAARRGPAQDRPAAAGLAGRPPRRAARLGHRLLPHRRRHPGDRRLPALARPRRRGVLRPDRAHRAAGARGGPRSTAGSRRWSPPAPSAWASTRPSASWSTWARRSRRSPTTSRSAAPAAAPTRRPSCCCPAIEDRDIWAYFASLAFPREELVRQTLAGARRRGRPIEHADAGDAGRAQPHPARDDAQGARRRRRRTPRARRLGGDRPGVGLRRGALRPGARGPRARAAGDARLHRDRRVPDGVPARPARRPRGRSRAAAATTAAGSTLSADVSAAAVEEADGAAVPARRRRSSRGRMWPTALANLGVDLRGQDRRGRRGGPGGRPADRPRLRPGAARPVPRRHARTGRCPCRWPARSSRCSSDWRPAGRRHRRRRVGDPADADRRPGRRAVPLPQGAGRRPVGDRRPRRRARAGAVELRPAGGRRRARASRCRPRCPTALGCCSSTTGSSPAGR